nr:LOW QUALITY PROTEIN: bromodomain-containing protein DDB_G0270170-like [Lepeophtheirus salmonis]
MFPPKRFKYEEGSSNGPPMSLMSKSHQHIGGRDRRNNSNHVSRRTNLVNQKGHIKRGRAINNPRRNPRKKKSDEICKMFMQGKCQKTAENCLYSHDAVPPKMMELCKFYLFERCAKRDKCLYLHKEFPCKYFHTGNKCVDSAEACKFSHEPLSDDTRGILLKHLESAPKEILGEFPRLTREVAASVVFNVEAKNKGWLDDSSKKRFESNLEESENENMLSQDTASEKSDNTDKQKIKEINNEMEVDELDETKMSKSSEEKREDEVKRKRKSRWETEPENSSSSSTSEGKQNHFSAVPFPINTSGIVPPGYGCPNFSEKFKGTEVQNFLKKQREGKIEPEIESPDEKEDIEIKQTPVPASIPGKRLNQGFQHQSQFKGGNNFQGRNSNFINGPNSNFNNSPNFMGNSHKQNFNGPNPNFNGPPNQNFVGPPNQNFNNGPPNQNFNGPPNQNFNGPPTQNFNGPPNQNFNGPPNQNFNGPPNQNFNGPPNQNFNGPNHNFNGPNQNYNGPPNQNYNGSNQNFNGPPNQSYNNTGPQSYTAPYNNYNGPPNTFNGPRSHNNFNGPRFSGDFRGGNRGGRFNNRNNFRGGRSGRGQQHNYNQRGHFFGGSGSNASNSGWNNGPQWNNSDNYNQNQYNEDDSYYENEDDEYHAEESAKTSENKPEIVPDKVAPEPLLQPLIPPIVKEPEESKTPLQRDPRANRDPRARRDPRKRDSPVHTPSSSAVVDEAEKERRILDLDISAFSELEIPSLNQEDEDEEDESSHGLPFKPNTLQGVAKEIDASILSRPSIDYILRPLSLEKPDYTEIIHQHHIPASQISQDPRLRRYSDKPPLKLTHNKQPSTTPVEPPSDVYNPKRDLIQQKCQNSTTPTNPASGEGGAYSPSQDIQDMYGKKGGSNYYKSPQQEDVYNPRKDLNADYGYQQGYKSGSNRSDPRMNRRDPRRRD